MKERKTRKITAEQARSISEKPDATLGKIYACIRERALQNSTLSYYGMVDPSIEAVDAIVKDLRRNGYNIDIKWEDDKSYLGITVKW